MGALADLRWMRRALALAKRGQYSCDPNPRVGCVLVRDGRIVAEGWHERAGGPHAEAMALAGAGPWARGATAYVTLEPCAHHGRTPPCADALIAAGVARVVYAIDDPFPEVAGRGAKRLREAGIEVESGVAAEAATELNVGFLSRIQRGRPFVRIKLAQSLDGRTALANGLSQWISSPAARADVQHWRARSSAILTGLATVISDDPRLTARPDTDLPLEQPVPVVVDSRLQIPATARLFSEHPEVLLACQAEAPRRPDLPAQATRLDLPPGEGGVCLPSLLSALARRGINELIVEAGSRLCGSLVRQGLVDELLLYVAPTLLGPAAKPLIALPEFESLAQCPRWHYVESAPVGPDLRLRLRPGERQP